jgi:hypothetical protein
VGDAGEQLFVRDVSDRDGSLVRIQRLLSFGLFRCTHTSPAHPFTDDNCTGNVPNSNYNPWNVTTQWHTDNSGIGFALRRSFDGTQRYRLYLGNAVDQEIWNDSTTGVHGNLSLDHWYDFVIHIRFQAGSGGLVELWKGIDGGQLVKQSFNSAFCGGGADATVCNTPTGVPGDNIAWFKQGHYRNGTVADTTFLYYKNTAAGTSFADVAPPSSPPPPSGQLALVGGALTLSPASPGVNEATTASFTVQNTGGQAVSVNYFLAGARTQTNDNVDFPTSPPVTLQPGEQYPYQATRSFGTSGPYTVWPAYFNGTDWIELAAHTTFTVQQAPSLFFDSFDRTTGLGANWTVRYGSYSTNGTAAVSGAPPVNGNWAKLNPSLGTANYAVAADLIVPAGSLFSGLVARSNDPNNVDRNLYAAQISTDGSVYLYRRNEWNWTPPLASAPAGIVANTSYNLKLVVTGASPVHLEVWLNGARKLAFDDNSQNAIASGAPGMQNYDAGVKYDNFTVTAQ